MGSDAGLERLELEDELYRTIAGIMVERLLDLEPRRRRPELLTRVEVLLLAEAAAKVLIDAGWRRG